VISDDHGPVAPDQDREPLWASPDLAGYARPLRPHGDPTYPYARLTVEPLARRRRAALRDRLAVAACDLLIGVCVGVGLLGLALFHWGQP
jgi:hypothetical protein